MEISNEDGFILTVVKVWGKKIKWAVLLFAIVTIATIGIQTTRVAKLQETVASLQSYIEKLEQNNND